MTRDELKGKIQTVLGPIAPETLGRTLMHEHVLCDIRPPGTRVGQRSRAGDHAWRTSGR